MTAPSRAQWLWPLLVTVLMQTESAFLTRVIPVIGPVMTEAAGIPPERIGYVASVVSAGTMWFLMSSGSMLRRLGPVRLLQIGATIGALAAALVILSTVPALFIAALFIGVGYGPSPSAGSDILARVSPKGARGLIFSIKQSAVPLGGALAGLAIPAITILYDWRIAMAAAALFAFGCALAVQPLRRRIDAIRDRAAPLDLIAFVSPMSLAQPFRAMKLAPSMWALAYVSICFACVQGTLFAFHVTYLTAEIGWTLAAAGIAFSTMQIVGVFARVIMGWVADRLGSGARALLLLSAGSTIMTLVTATISPGWSFALVTVISAVTGFAAASWNGVFMSEVAHLVRHDQVGDATAGATFFTFIGYVVAPAAFAAAVAVNGSYGLTFAWVAIMPFSAGLVLWFRVLRRGRSAH